MCAMFCDGEISVWDELWGSRERRPPGGRRRRPLALPLEGGDLLRLSSQLLHGLRERERVCAGAAILDAVGLSPRRKRRQGQAVPGHDGEAAVTDDMEEAETEWTPGELLELSQLAKTSSLHVEQARRRSRLAFLQTKKKHDQVTKH